MATEVTYFIFLRFFSLLIACGGVCGQVGLDSSFALQKTEDMVADTVSNLFTTFLLLAFSVNIFSRDVMDRMVCGQKNFVAFASSKSNSAMKRAMTFYSQSHA